MSAVPRVLREQARLYASHGFHIESVEHRTGSHFKVIFREFTEPQFLSCNPSDSHAWKNNIARFRRLAEKENRHEQTHS